MKGNEKEKEKEIIQRENVYTERIENIITMSKIENIITIKYNNNLKE